MSTTTVRLPSVEDFRPRRSTIIWGTVLLGIQAYMTGTYVTITNRAAGVDAYVLVPWVWINVALWVFVRTSPGEATVRDRAIAGLIAGAYCLVLFAISGVVGLGTEFTTVPESAPRLVLFEAPPGWTPALFYPGDYVALALRPPMVVGYAAIGYLLYATITDTRSVLVGGVVGLFSCVGCTVPIVVAGVAALAGGTAGIIAPENATAVGGYVPSTAVFLVTVGLLYASHRRSSE